MFTASWRMIVFSAVVWASVWACGTFQNRDTCQDVPSVQNARENQGRDAPVTQSEGPKAENLKALMVDLAAYNICERLKGRYHTLSARGSSSKGGKKTNTGMIRIDRCEARETDSKQLHIELSGIGWQWISRDKEQLGATFTVDDNAKFAVDISMVGTFDTAYDQEKHVLNVWFVPSRLVDVDLKVMGNVQVDADSIWSSIVGIAGSLVGKSPEERAEKTIRKQGSRLFQSKLSSGLTLIVDLCSGKHYFKLGTFPAGELPESAAPGKSYLVNSTGVLHPGSMLAAGPFDVDKSLTAAFTAAEGGVRAIFVCEGDAEKITEAYMNDAPLPGIKPLAEKIVRSGKPDTLRIGSDPGCRVVLIMTLPGKQAAAATFDYAAYHEGEKTKPLMDCSGK